MAALRARVFLIGQGSQAALKLQSEIARDGHTEIVGWATIETAGLAARARARGADVIVVAVDDRRGLNVRELLACRLAGLEVIDGPTFAERALKKIPVDLVKPGDLVFSDGFERPAWLLAGRRAGVAAGVAGAVHAGGAGPGDRRHHHQARLARARSSTRKSASAWAGATSRC